MTFLYGLRHRSVNTVTPAISYEKLPSLTKQHLHIDSFVLKNHSKLYGDSLLMRYNKSNVMNADYINSYIGSHGIISFNDKIMPCSSFLGLTSSYQNSNLALNPNYIIDYANISRIDCFAHKINAHNLINKNIQLQDRRLLKHHHAYVAEFVGTYAPDIFFSNDFAPSEAYHLDNFKLDFYYQGKQLLHFDNKDYRFKYYLEHNYQPIFFGVTSFSQDINPKYAGKLRYLNGSLLYQPKIRFDYTHFFYANSFTTDLSSIPNNTVYSAGNSYFLTCMFKNLYNLKRYHIIDVYYHGLHLTPLVFNCFVKIPNIYDSPYLFNNLYTTSSNAITAIENVDYNLPSNYDAKHYYYRTISGTLLKDTDIQYVNNHIKPLIMGNPTQKHFMPVNAKFKSYYATDLEYKFARKYNKNFKQASQQLNFKRCDSALEPLWIIGLINNKQIGTYRPGEILKFNDTLSLKKISHYYIVKSGKRQYIPVYKINKQDCFKAICTFKNKTKRYVRAQDAYLLMGYRVRHD